MSEDSFTPPGHVRSKTKQIQSRGAGWKVDCSIAEIEPDGGGPTNDHTHLHDHFFFVIEGEAINIPGSIPHSVWNRGSTPLWMIGVNI